MLWLFLLAVGFCVYTYAVFPLLLHWRARRTPRPVAASALPAVLPRVSIVIAAHDEATTLPAKYASLAALDYPSDRLEVVLVSDGSADDTLAVARALSAARPHWQCLEYQPARGKPTALNTAVAAAGGEILVFMDARQTVSADAVTVLVTALQDDSVGAVSGELVLGADPAAGDDAVNVGLYWRYEKWIRQNESRLFSTTGATGALYAIRRRDYTPHRPDVLLDDFDTPIALLARGRRTVFAPEARAYDRAEGQGSAEFRRKVRTLAGNFQSFARHPWLFDPRRNPVWWQFLSHKVFRLLVPYALALALFASAAGEGVFLDTMLLVQLAFYALGIGAWLGVVPAGRVANFIKVFLQLNAAAVIGAIRYLGGDADVRWKRS